jgi:primosomal protein N' (replication factor Y) (superfamily II helicase)
MAGCCEVALPVPLRTTFTYVVPDAFDEAVVPGVRVVVPFRNQSLIGLVTGRGDGRPDGSRLRELTEVLDLIPALPASLVALGRWAASYYLAPVGETFRAMLPPCVELRVRREWQITESGRARLQELQSLSIRSQSDIDELALLQLCEAEPKSVDGGLTRKLPGGQAAVARLVRRGQLSSRQTTHHRAARTRKIVAWKFGANAERARSAEVRVQQVLAEQRGPLPLAQLLRIAGVSRVLVKRLLQQGKLQIWEEPLAPEPELLESEFTPPSNVLNEEQQRVVQEIRRWIDAGVFTAGLLYGVTGSGKTEVYARAVESALARGRTALVLVPEIALTLWIGRLCRAWFGEGVAVLHSGLSDQERSREWWRVRRGEARVVVGTRSAVFAPLEKLGLIIVDEEQESSYKQEETPRYHGRDVAVMRAKLEGAVALLGSATPSLESFHHARLGKYKLLRLESRVENRPLAAVEIVDLREDFRQTHHPGPISERLQAAIAAQLAAGTQAIVLINRRGYSWFVLCRSCGTAVLCENCSIALTYHKARERLACHYCGFSRRVPKACPHCASEHVYFVGAGSEQLEEHLRALFPKARIARLDRDTARSKRAFEHVLNAFSAGRVDILVGTQILAKGHDFKRVTLVGVASADAQLGFPDFRAAERTFQLLTQVAGRAGRGALAGTVLVETYLPEHYAIQLAARQDYPSFFEKELHFRRVMHYPPFVALASLLVRDTRLEQALRWCRQLAAFFESASSQAVKVLGPAAAPLARLKREHRFQFLLKSPRRAALNGVLSECLQYCAEKGIPERAILVDVDPLSLL